MRIAEQIAGVPLFNGLPEKQLEELGAICLSRKFEKGRTLFSERSEAKGFYVILAGKVKIYKLSVEGKEQILHIFGPGEIFGEVPVFAGGNYPASAQAIESAVTLFFPRTAFVDLIGREPSLALNMLALLSQRLRRFTHLIEDLSLKEVPGRLSAYLVYLGERSGNRDALELDITKAQLASLLGTIPETLSRILAKMAQQGVIAVEGRRIRLLDREALDLLAAGGKGQLGA